MYSTMNNIIIKLTHLILAFLLLPIFTIIVCSCNTRERQQTHLERRQALRERQRQAVLSGRSVRSVIETEVDSETVHCPTWVCVGKLTPRLKNPNEVYERIDQFEEASENLNKEKPPFTLIVDSPNNRRKSMKMKNVKYTDLVSNDFDVISTSSCSYVNSMV
ncbi:hypothetical protein GCK72_017518 [Caenorhabditis remanei]|uniref:Uncharacterized protein n=1 Tax=Caenorhabditis remanei TaxID=31234 RepID=A0A6A5G7I7_CAERE|nr:hypothetical protein GCK72_017518 [Caenorhabditis remanei]KAF1750967.1 hypothetical protein GCK72_017518 [Caenorhabditis remanei]